AIANYAGFRKAGFEIKALFDANPRMIGLKIREFEVLDSDTLEGLKLIVNIIEENFTSIYNESGKIYLFRKFGVPFVVGCLDYKKV
ncbi:hypothetical protein ACTPD5_21560, partial [Clostridioides difficile]